MGEVEREAKTTDPYESGGAYISIDSQPKKETLGVTLARGIVSESATTVDKKNLPPCHRNAPSGAHTSAHRQSTKNALLR